MPLKPPIRSNQVYSLWLIPEKSAFEFFHASIADLSDKYGGPAFIPHVTLLSGLEGNTDEMTLASQQVAKLVLPLTIRLTDFGYENHYYKSVYISAENSPELLEAHNTAKSVFGIKEDKKFHPHLSLAYGLENQEEIVGKLSRDLIKQFEVKKLVLVSTGGRWKIGWLELSI